MSKNRYTPPPDFRGENIDRGFTDSPAPQPQAGTQLKLELPVPPSAPVSYQFPVSPNTPIVDTTNMWYNRD